MRKCLSSLPRHHSRPSLKLEKPLCFPDPDNYPSAPLIPQKFRSVLTRELRECHELVFDPNTQVRSKGPRFSGDFESANLGQVYRIGPRRYEIHILPDPSKWYSALWFMFRVENLKPGEYMFVICGFFRDCHQHNIGVQPTVYSEHAARRGCGWKRVGTNMNFWTWKHSLVPEFAMSFNFVVTHTDTMYFSLLYPYTYTELRRWLSMNCNRCMQSTLCRSYGGVDVPVVFWDADEGRCVDVKNLPKRTQKSKKPLVVIAARLHPGESNSSFAMEGLMDRVFDCDGDLLNDFSWLMIPMMNPDGVICGYYRPTVNGLDENRTWKNPSPVENPVPYNVIRLLEELTKTRKLVFLLDFHGHTAQSNAFSYGVKDPMVPYNQFERLFPKVMASCCHLFEERECISWGPNEFPTTMRVALHNRFAIPFAYTLEMSFGAISIGPDKGQQMTPHHYRFIGEMTANAIQKMFATTPRKMANGDFTVPSMASICTHTY